MVGASELTTPLRSPETDENESMPLVSCGTIVPLRLFWALPRASMPPCSVSFTVLLASESEEAVFLMPSLCACRPEAMLWSLAFCSWSVSITGETTLLMAGLALTRDWSVAKMFWFLVSRACTSESTKSTLVCAATTVPESEPTAVLALAETVPSSTAPEDSAEESEVEKSRAEPRAVVSSALLWSSAVVSAGTWLVRFARVPSALESAVLVWSMVEPMPSSASRTSCTALLASWMVVSMLLWVSAVLSLML